MKVFLCSIALCLIATSFGADKNVGDMCAKDDKCKDNSECKKNEKNAFCEDMKCYCKENYMMDSAKKCLLKDGQACETANKDDDKCITAYCNADKKCACKSGSWSKKLMKCADGKVFDEECNTTDKKCASTPANLKCDTKCKCKDGYEQMDKYDDVCSKEMMVGFDADCTTKTCNKNLNLKCMANKKCECDTSKDYKKTKVEWTDEMGVSKSVYKCLHVNATVNAAKGDECLTGVFDDTAIYCAKGLWCGNCGSEKKMTCKQNVKKPTGGAGQVTFGIFVAISCFALRKFIM